MRDLIKEELLNSPYVSKGKGNKAVTEQDFFKAIEYY